MQHNNDETFYSAVVSIFPVTFPASMRAVYECKSVLYCTCSLMQLDCFHPSLIAHQHLAKALWNNMLTPAAKKKDYFDWKEDFVCPTNTTLLYTD